MIGILQYLSKMFQGQKYMYLSIFVVVWTLAIVLQKYIYFKENVLVYFKNAFL